MLARTAGFELLGEGLEGDVNSAIEAALAGGVVFPGTAKPLAIFRESLTTSIRDIESHRRGRLLQKFLTKGPYADVGEIPAAPRDKWLGDDETALAIRFVHSFMVNSFKGAVTELLASAPCLSVLEQLQRQGVLPGDARLYAGDAVRTPRLRKPGFAKGADLHILIVHGRSDATPIVTVAGVAEVKSYFRSEERLRTQLDQHLRRARQGVEICGARVPQECVTIGYREGHQAVRLMVLPSDWPVPRTFRFEPSAGGRSLHVEPPVPPAPVDRTERIGDDEWRITLRWSREAIEAAAYEMTFWYMAKIGEVIYSHGVPREWSEMTPAEAGRNAAKMMLYYAILRARTPREEQRAIALYNSYSFGYALGMNFRNREGRREMLWPQDLDEIAAKGQTDSGCRVVG